MLSMIEISIFLFLLILLVLLFGHSKICIEIDILHRLISLKLVGELQSISRISVTHPHQEHPTHSIPAIWLHLYCTSSLLPN